jgi:hypothetical protein
MVGAEWRGGERHALERGDAIDQVATKLSEASFDDWNH